MAAILNQHRQSKMSTEIRKQINIRWIKLRYANDVLHHMKKGRAHGPENITLGGRGGLEVLDDFGIEDITKLLNNIYNSRYILNYLLKPKFITLPKEVGALKCEDCSTINLISYMTKLLQRTVVKRIRNIKPEINYVGTFF